MWCRSDVRFSSGSACSWHRMNRTFQKRISHKKQGKLPEAYPAKLCSCIRSFINHVQCCYFQLNYKLSVCTRRGHPSITSDISDNPFPLGDFLVLFRNLHSCFLICYWVFWKSNFDSEFEHLFFEMQFFSEM